MRAAATRPGGRALPERLPTMSRGPSSRRSGTIIDYFLALIATALGRMGLFHEALRITEEAFSVTQRTHPPWFEAQVDRRKGELLHKTRRTSRPLSCYSAAIEVARKQRRIMGVRATTSLALAA